jgi:surface protein
MKTNYTQIYTKGKTASSYASFFKSSISKCSKTLLAFLFTLLFVGNSFAQSGDFVTKWNLATTGSGATQLTIGTSTSGTVSYSWTEVGGSGSGSGTFSGSPLTITGLPTGATIRLRISRTNFKRIFLNASTDKVRLLDIEQWGTTAWENMQNAFFGCSNLNITATDIPNLDSMSTTTTRMDQMFQDCRKLSSIPNINSWNVSKITVMTSLFNGCTLFNQNIGDWNIVNVVGMVNMLNNCGMDCDNYSATLIGWSTQSTTGRTLGASGVKYGAYASAARTTLTSSNGWSISDGGVGTCNDPSLTITTQTGLYDYQGVQVTEDAVNRTWVVTASSDVIDGGLAFQWTNSSPNLELTGFDRTSLGVYTRTSGYTGSGDWTLVETGSALRVGTTSTYYTTVTGLTLNEGMTYYFGVSNSITPLPVSIIDFKGIVKNDIISLNWTVADENDLNRYDVYSSTDGINFSLCGSVTATVPERGLKTYQFQDLSNKSALVYYRLKSINNDETGEWSSIVALHTNKTAVNKPMKVYPNPATDFINLEFDGIDASNFNVLVMDMSGKVVYKLDGVETAINQYTLPLNGIESGMYIVQLSDEFGNTTINRFSIK